MWRQLIAYEIIFPIAARAMGLPNRAGFGDLFADDPKLFTRFMVRTAINPLLHPDSQRF